MVLNCLQLVAVTSDDEAVYQSVLYLHSFAMARHEGMACHLSVVADPFVRLVLRCKYMYYFHFDKHLGLFFFNSLSYYMWKCFDIGFSKLLMQHPVPFVDEGGVAVRADSLEVDGTVIGNGGKRPNRRFAALSLFSYGIYIREILPPWHSAK